VEKIEQSIGGIKINIEVRPQRRQAHQPEKHNQNDDGRDEERPESVDRAGEGRGQERGGHF